MMRSRLRLNLSTSSIVFPFFFPIEMIKVGNYRDCCGGERKIDPVPGRDAQLYKHLYI